MKKVLIALSAILFLAAPVSAMELEAPPVPESGEALMPYDTESFWEGVWSIVSGAISKLRPDLADGLRTAGSLVGILVLLSAVKAIPGTLDKISELVGVTCVSLLLIGTSGSMIRLATDTVTEMSEYGKLLFPVLTAALAAQGGSVTSAALYTGTLAFDAILSSLVSVLLVPMSYILLCLSVVKAATGQELIGKLRDFIKWLMTWSMKILLYVFTGYMGITGVVSGTTDAAALKATKLAISGMVPVIGGILSDTSEAVLVGAGVVKNAVGVYGLLSVLAVWISPFLRIGVQYILLKGVFGLSSIFPAKQTGGLLKDFSGVMGLLLAMTGMVCLFLLVSVVCFMKGTG